MADDRWLKAVGAALLRAVGVGLVVAVVVGLAGSAIGNGSCGPDAEECLAGLAGLFFGPVAGGVAATCAVAVIGTRRGLGPLFCTGAAFSFLLLTVALWKVWSGDAGLWASVAVLVLVVTLVVSRRTTELPTAPGGRTTLVLSVVGVAAIALTVVPVMADLGKVRDEERRIEAVVRQPPQPDLDGTSPYSVVRTDSQVRYDVLEPVSANGDRIADVEVTVRTLDAQPCEGFDDLAEGPMAGCTEVQPGVWQAQAQEGDHPRVHLFVRGRDRVWAHVAAPNHFGAAVQRGYDARAVAVARSMKPRSAWPLAAEAVDCGYCAWFG